MILSDVIITTYPGGFSGVYIHCPAEKIDEVAAKFEAMFELAWNDAMDKVEEDYGWKCLSREDRGNPATIKKLEGKVLVELEPLYLEYGKGSDFGINDLGVDNRYGVLALTNTLDELKEKYPEISYEGLIAYMSDGGIVKYEISSESLPENNKKIYPFVKDTLAFAFGMGYSEDVASEMKDYINFLSIEIISLFESVLKDFLVYDAPEAAIRDLLEAAEKVNGKIRDRLDKMIEAWNNGEELDVFESEIDIFESE